MGKAASSAGGVAARRSIQRPASLIWASKEKTAARIAPKISVLKSLTAWRPDSCPDDVQSLPKSVGHVAAWMRYLARMSRTDASKKLADLLHGMTAHDGLALLVGGLAAILAQAPSTDEREASLENVISAFRDRCSGARPPIPTAPS